MYEKIKEYLQSIWYEPKDIDKMAKDITEIVKAELSDTIYADLMKSEYELQKENAELKSQLSNIKYLSKGKVTKIIEDLLNSRTDINYGICDSITGNPMKDYVMQLQKIAEKAIDKILSLAIPNKDKITNVLETFIFNQRLSDGHSQKYVGDFSYRKPVMLNEKDIEDIANEIIKE